MLVREGFAESKVSAEILNWIDELAGGWFAVVCTDGGCAIVAGDRSIMSCVRVDSCSVSVTSYVSTMPI